MDLKDTVALVTGGSEGIGRAIAEALTEQGGNVTITGRREDALRKTAEELGLDWIVGDVGNEDDAANFNGLWSCYPFFPLCLSLILFTLSTFHCMR